MVVRVAKRIIVSYLQEAEPPSEAGTSGFGIGFQKASDFLPVKSPALSTEDTSVMEVTPSCSCSTGYTSNASDTLPPIVGFQSASSILKCTATTKSSTSISKARVSTSKLSIVTRKSSDVDGTFSKQSRSRSTSPLHLESKTFSCDNTDMKSEPVTTSSPISTASSLIDIASSTVMETTPHTLTGFQPSSVLMCSMKNSSSSLQKPTVEVVTRTNPSVCKPSSLMHSRKDSHTSSLSAISTSTDKLSGFRPASSLISSKEAPPSDQQMVHTVGHSNRRHDTTSDSNRDSPATATSHDHHMTFNNGKCNKQKVASLVVSVLNPYLKKGKITDKV